MSKYVTKLDRSLTIGDLLKVHLQYFISPTSGNARCITNYYIFGNKGCCLKNLKSLIHVND